MTWCLDPNCPKPQNPDDVKFCQHCGVKLLLGDRYRPIKPIGQGGFGRTFLASDEHIPSRPLCVIKQFYPPLQTAQQAQKAAEMFDQEALRLDQLGQHPQIPNLLAHFTQDNQQYLVQTFIDGLTLEAAQNQQGNFSPEEIRLILLDLLPVLQFIHDRQVIHRDIKPANLIRQRRDGKLVIVDFGASKFATPQNLRHTGTVIGSAGYSAPEQIAGKATFASDLYSLGVTCLHLLTGVEPFDLYSFMEGCWSWRDYLQAPVSDDLGHVLDKLVDPILSRRYPSAAAALDDLKPNQPAIVGSPAPSSPPPPPPTTHHAPPTNPTPWICLHTLAGHSNAIATIAIHPNGRSVASGGYDTSIKIWHVGTGALISSLSGHHQPVMCLAFSREGSQLISGSVDDTIKVWNLHTELLQYILTEQAESRVSLSMALSPDGQAIATGSDNHTIKMWDLRSGNLFRTMVQDRAVTCVAISPDGKLLASGSSDNRVRLWDFGTGKFLGALEGHQRDVNAVAFSPSSQFLASGSSDNTIRLWHLPTRSPSHTFTGHQDWVKTVAVHPDGRLLASGSSDNTIKIWDVSTKKLLHTLIGHGRDVNAIVFSRDGNLLISGSSDRTLKIWRREPSTG
jgi:serine/threonine protein kinase